MKELVLSLSALADPTRLRLLHLMGDGEICVCYLQAVLGANQPKISRHLAYLRKAGLAVARREGKWMHYRIKQQPKEREEMVAHALAAVANSKQGKGDRQRLKKVKCCPADYGI